MNSPGSQIEIPGEPGLIRSVVPPVRVDLPLEAKTTDRLLWAGLAMAPAALSTAATAAAFMWMAFRSETPIAFVVLMGLAGLTALGTLHLASAIVIGILDANRSGVVLSIGRKGLQDHRFSPDMIPWSDIAHADTVTNASLDYSGIMLTFRSDRDGFRPILRLGSVANPAWPWGRQKNRLDLSVARLSVPGHILGETVLAMVRANDGKVGQISNVTGRRITGV